MMHLLPLWSSAMIQFNFLLGSKSNDQKEDPEQEKEDGSTADPLRQFDATNEASNLAQEYSAKKEGFSSRKLGEATTVSKPVSPSPSRLEQAADDQDTGLAEAVKSQTQVALALLTLSASAIISAKGTTFAHPEVGQRPAAGGQAVNLPVFFFWWSIALWFTGLLFSMSVVLLTTFEKKSPGMLLYAKRINAFDLFVLVAGVAFWILS